MSQTGRGIDSVSEPAGVWARAARICSDWCERWFPDPFVFALLGVALVFLAGIAAGENPRKLAIEGGKGFWSLSAFTLQMVMVVVSGYVVASTPAVRFAIRRIAQLPSTPRMAIAAIALFSMLASLVSWGLSLVFSGLLVREMAVRVKGLDYRAAGAAAYLGLGAVWAMGLSSSAAMLMATKPSIPAALLKVSGVLPLTQTLFLWPSLVTTALLIVVSTLVAYATAPDPRRAKPIYCFPEAIAAENGGEDRPGRETWLERTPILTVGVAALLVVYLVDLFRTVPQGALAALDLNTYILIMLVIGLVLHWRPRPFLKAVSTSITGAAGILVQFPMFGVMSGMITGTAISARLAHLFTTISNHQTYALVVAAYSATLGVFVPSGGTKWVLEAPYVLSAANTLHVHLGWVVQIYNASEALPNLLNPFWMAPLLGILKLKAKDLVGYGLVQLAVHIPLVFFLCWLFARELPYVAP